MLPQSAMTLAVTSLALTSLTLAVTYDHACRMRDRVKRERATVVVQWQSTVDSL